MNERRLRYHFAREGFGPAEQDYGVRVVKWIYRGGRFPYAKPPNWRDVNRAIPDEAIPRCARGR